MRLGLVAGGGVGDDALGAAVGAGGDDRCSPAADADDIGFGQVLQDVRARCRGRSGAGRRGGGRRRRCGRRRRGRASTAMTAAPKRAASAASGAAAAADVPDQVADARAEPGELGGAQLLRLALAEGAAVRLGGQRPAARAAGEPGSRPAIQPPSPLGRGAGRCRR